jgi:hypothetical protein
MDRDRLTALPPLAHTSQRTCLACPTPTDQPYCSAACRRRNNGGVPIIRPGAARVAPARPVRPRWTRPLQLHPPVEDAPVPTPPPLAARRQQVRELVVLGKQDCGRCGFPHEVYGYPGDELDP